MDNNSCSGNGIEFLRMRRAIAAGNFGKNGAAGYTDEVQLLPENLSCQGV